ncbi:MAG: helix-turn-helix domain-containing protein [Candidatus Binataceae bacterium]
MRPVGGGKRLERRRLRAIALLEQGQAPVEVARLRGVDWRSVRRWNAAYRRQGARGLAARPAPGRPSKLSPGQRRQLLRMLRRGAVASGFERDVWTYPRVAEVLRRRFGISYHVDHLGRLPRSLGWTPQRPPRRAPVLNYWIKWVPRRRKK